MSHPAPPRTAAPTRGGRVFLVFLGLSLVLIGGVFVWLMGRSYLRAREMRSWPEVHCVILVSEIETRRHDPQSPLEYRHDVTFGYEWQDQARTSDRISLRGGSWSSKREIAEGRMAEYPVGASRTCRVHPKDPDFAVLKPDSLAPGYSIWFPGLFVLGGAVMVIRAFVPDTKTPPANTPPPRMGDA